MRRGRHPATNSSNNHKERKNNVFFWSVVSKHLGKGQWRGGIGDGVCFLAFETLVLVFFFFFASEGTSHLFLLACFIRNTNTFKYLNFTFFVCFY